MKTARYLAAAGLIVSVAVSCPAVAANLLINGSFEDTTNFLPNGQNTDVLVVGSTAMTGWTVITRDIAWIGPSNPFSLTASPGGGSYFLDLTSYNSGLFGGVTQTIATVAGATYLLSFDLGSSPQFGVQSGIAASAGSTNASFVSTNSGNQNNLWESESLRFTATGTSTAISLLGNTGSQYVGLDNVSVTQLAGPAVPEPATWAMMMIGLGAVGVAMRRRPQVATRVSFGG